MKKVKIYTDGACRKDGLGGWAYVMVNDIEVVENNGVLQNTTSNRAELMGVISGLEALKEPHEVEVYSDSAYVVECFNKRWFEKWYSHGWKNSEGKPIKNKDLWLRLFTSMDGHKIKFVKVKGHSDDEFNNRCDELAGIAVENANAKRKN